MLKETIIKECIVLLKRDDVKKEIKNLISPLTELILVEIYPYLYFALMFFFIGFCLNVVIFILFLYNKLFFCKKNLN